MTIQKPDKPYEDYPLFPHNNGQWAKKIRGKMHYFGKWEEPDAAVAKYLDQRDYLLAGKPAPNEDGHTILEVCDRFLVKRQHDVRAGQISQTTYDDYKANCDLLIKLAGSLTIETMTPEDWAKLRADLCDGVGTTTAANRIRLARVALRYLDAIAQIMPRWCDSFSEPSKMQKRVARKKAGDRTHTPIEIRTAIEGANKQFAAILLLGINCAFGNGDCSAIQWEHIDLDGGWHTFERPKTAIDRKAKLWPETITALRCLLPEGSPALGRVFQTKYGNDWSTTAIAQEARKLGIVFYNLRRTFRTIADDIADTKAIRLIMGHAASDGDMDARYTQRIADERLVKISDHVHDWLFEIKTPPKGRSKTRSK